MGYNFSHEKTKEGAHQESQKGSAASTFKTLFDELVYIRKPKICRRRNS
jgi:hypothetical protein